MTLLSRLFLLIAAALVPEIAIQTYNEFELRRSRQIEVQDQALGLAKVAAPLAMQRMRWRDTRHGTNFRSSANHSTGQSWRDASGR